MLLLKLKISGHSMEPTIKNNSYVLVSSLPYLFGRPKINDIASFKYEDKMLIKRIIKISKDRYYVVGDNRKDSFDSKKFGEVQEKNLLGKVIYIFK